MANKGALPLSFLEAIESRSYRGLSMSARSLVWEIAARASRVGNGAVAFGVRDAARRCGIGAETARRAFSELAVAGFLICSNPGERTGAASAKASEWRLTFMPTDEVPPTRDFLKAEHWVASDTARAVRGAKGKKFFEPDELENAPGGVSEMGRGGVSEMGRVT